MPACKNTRPGCRFFDKLSGCIKERIKKLRVVGALENRGSACRNTFAA